LLESDDDSTRLVFAGRPGAAVTIASHDGQQQQQLQAHVHQAAAHRLGQKTAHQAGSVMDVKLVAPTPYVYRKPATSVQASRDATSAQASRDATSVQASRDDHATSVQASRDATSVQASRDATSVQASREDHATSVQASREDHSRRAQASSLQTGISQVELARNGNGLEAAELLGNGSRSGRNIERHEYNASLDVAEVEQGSEHSGRLGCTVEELAWSRTTMVNDQARLLGEPVEAFAVDRARLVPG
jgi:hypothetical protein